MTEVTTHLRGDSRRQGVALLLTLLIVVAVTLLGHAAFLLTLGESRALARHRMQVQAWYELEGDLAAGVGERFIPLPGGALLQWGERDLPPHSGVDRRLTVAGGRLWWQLDPVAESEWILARAAPQGVDPGPLRLGGRPLGWWLHALVWEELRHEGHAAVHRYPPGRDAGPTLLWAPGDLHLPHPLLPREVEGLVLVEGRLHLSAGAWVVGGILTGSGVATDAHTGSGVVRDGPLLEAALQELANAVGVLPMPGGWISPFPW